MNQPLIITPKTKVGQLLEAYPQLEEVLISFAPEFNKLKNPILRKTVGRIATLQQAASVANVKIEELINKLRAAVGQETFLETQNTMYNTTKPGWFDERQVLMTLDVKPLIAAGEHPVNQIMSELKNLPTGKIFKMIAPFLPAPLIDKATSLEAEHYIVKISETDYHVYFCKL